MSRSFLFPAEYSRKLPDPNFKGLERHILLARICDLPTGVPLDPNPREPNVNRKVYKEIRQSLLGEGGVHPGTFHLKHKGITIVAGDVRFVKRDGTNWCVVTLEEQSDTHPGHGILDGGHTYALFEEYLKLSQPGNDVLEGIPADQFVKVEILTNVDPDWIPDLAAGLNTSVQVQAMSLDNLAKRFDWLKDELRDEPYFEQIAWREGEQRELDARDIVAIMTCFNIKLYPNGLEELRHPIAAHEKKMNALKSFEDDPEEYLRMRPILKDILELSDRIRYEARNYWNAKEGGGRFGSLAFVDSRKRGEYVFPFIGQSHDQRMMDSALFPMLAAFRCMVEYGEDGNYRWKGGFSSVRERWAATAVSLVRTTHRASIEFANSPNKVGKSRNHWQQIYSLVQLSMLQAALTS